MHSIRALARAAPRFAARTTSTLGRSTLVSSRSSSLLAYPTRASSAALTPRLASAFSTSSLRASQQPEPESEKDLVAKLDSEIQFEEELADKEQVPVSIQDYLDNSPFKLVDSPGQEEVRLVREYGDEKITVTFTIADLSENTPDMYDEDPAMADAEDSLQEPGSSRNAAAQQGEEPSEELGEEGEEGEDLAPCRLSIVIEKPGRSAGALNIDATVQQGGFIVENLAYVEDASVAHESTPEAAHSRATSYLGPPFGSLDEDLQVLVERYLEERGISQPLAIFVADYVDVKEQKEYVRWLKNVKGFVSS